MNQPFTPGHPGIEQGLPVPAATSQPARLLGEFAVAIDGGPRVDCAHTGTTMTCGDFHHETCRRPGFFAVPNAAGFRAGRTLPMRRREHVIDTLNLLHGDVHVLTHDRVLAQAWPTSQPSGCCISGRSLTRKLCLPSSSRPSPAVLVEQARGIAPGIASDGEQPAGNEAQIFAYDEPAPAMRRR